MSNWIDFGGSELNIEVLGVPYHVLPEESFLLKIVLKQVLKVLIKFDIIFDLLKILLIVFFSLVKSMSLI